jgi:predicted ArsR family transcriptional regulator
VSDLDARLDQIAALGEPVRRALFRFVASQAQPASRDQAAGAVDVARHVAKFHLDRLVTDGLLEATYQRPAGRSGPGAGRPTKLYQAVPGDLTVSIPERQYALAGHVLVRAIGASQRENVPPEEAMEQAALAMGHHAGADVFDRLGAYSSDPAGVTEVEAVLEDHGYAPEIEGDTITLRNCPFHALVEDETELVCGMNRAFIAGVLDGLQVDTLDAQLDPGPGRCCVRVCRR